MIALPVLAGVALLLAAEQLALTPPTGAKAPSTGEAGQLEMQSSTALGTGNTCVWGSADCNPCVKDVAASVRSLRNRGDILGFHKGPAPDPTVWEHWQGIQRLMGRNSNILVVSSSNQEQAGVSTVQMASRNKSGLRFRSNRLDLKGVEDTPPPNQDKIIRYQRLDRTYKHASGFQTVGHFAAVGLEDANNGAKGRVVILSYASPATPSEQTQSALTTYPSGDAGTVSIGRLASGRYLLIVGNDDANDLLFYRSTTSDLSATGWESVASWNKGGTDGWGAYQNISLVSQCDGRLFLLGTHNNSVVGQLDDYIDAYTLSLNIDEARVQITRVANRHLYCSWGSLSDQCNLDAAGGVYVDPEGRLIVYATEHDNDGPDCTIKMEEFRSAIAPTSCSRISDAWAELYDDSGFGDRGLMIDFVDRNRERYDNFDKVEWFGDKTSSARACLPSGWRFSLYEHDGYGGSRRDLEGTGALVEVSSFGGFGDETSSARFDCLQANGQWTAELDRCQ